jgi:hypothetical protein
MSSLEHFVRLANAGKHPGCSSGERAARRIALCLLKESLVLDGTATAGIVEYLALVQRHPTKASDLVK